jgi:DNA-binding IclR family transcriptional regulator
MTVLYRIGGRLPLHSTGVGLVLLAHAEREFQEELLARPLMHEPEHRPVDHTALRRRLADTRRDGLVIVHRNVPEPLVAVAAPIRGGVRHSTTRSNCRTGSPTVRNGYSMSRST